MKQLLTITIVIFFLMYLGAVFIQGGGFTKPQMFFNILNANAALIITAVGMSIVMISGGIDFYGTTFEANGNLGEHAADSFELTLDTVAGNGNVFTKEFKVL